MESSGNLPGEPLDGPVPEVGVSEGRENGLGGDAVEADEANEAPVAGATSLEHVAALEGEFSCAGLADGDSYADLEYAFAMYGGLGDEDTLTALRHECSWAIGPLTRASTGSKWSVGTRNGTLRRLARPAVSAAGQFRR